MVMSALISNDCKRADKQHRAVRWERRMTSIGETRLAWLPLLARHCLMRRHYDLWILCLMGSIISLSTGSTLASVVFGNNNSVRFLWMLMSALISKDCKRAEKQHRAVRWERRMTSIGETRLAWLPLIAWRCSMRRQCNEVVWHWSVQAANKRSSFLVFVFL